MNGSATRPNFRILFVLGLGRSGSTLLGRLLDNHPGVVGVGELLRLDQVIADPQSKCSCGLPAADCPDWSSLIDGIPEKVKRNYKKWTPDLLNRVRENGCGDVLVDVSKTRGYRLAKGWKRRDVGYVLLLRDPRGIFRSYAAEHEDFSDRLKLHKKWIVRYAAFARRRKDCCHVMYYEDLATSTGESMRGLCDFMGIPFVDDLLRPDAKVHHVATCSGSSYQRGTGVLKLDERWREEMKPEHIGLISGALKSLPLYERYRLADQA